MKSVIVIGSGIAGLASALRMRKRGYNVTVIEANTYPGGKLSKIEGDGFRFDAGPSLFTLPYLVDELFEMFGDNPKDFFRYSKLEDVCNYFWNDGASFQMSSNEDEFVESAAEFFSESKDTLKEYLDKSSFKYNSTKSVFLEKSLHKASTYLSLDTLKAFSGIYKLDLNDTLNDLNSKYFKNEKLIQLFNRYATYNGSSPYKTPGIMSLIPHLEMKKGAFFPEGGMISITNSLYEYAQSKGVKFNLNERVENVEKLQDKTFKVTSSKSDYFSDTVISNSDIYYSYKQLLKKPLPNSYLKQEKSSSGLIFYWGVKGSFENLDLHNIFFSEDYKEEFKSLFETKEIYSDPTIYLNISSKYNENDAPNNHENWFVMINAPSGGDIDWDNSISILRKIIINKINKVLNIDLENLIVFEDVLTPPKIESKTSSHLGALYGTSSNSKMSAFFRHPNFKRGEEGLYFCGGSVHPGGGIPLCLLSAKIVDELID